MELHDVILRPWVSEKSHLSTRDRKYTFMIDPRANKIQVKEAVEKNFNVKVTDVNMFTSRGREGSSWTKQRRIHGRGPRFKKAIVTLAEGQSIPELSESS
jgi:large subunit ribosomal protein L23